MKRLQKKKIFLYEAVQTSLRLKHTNTGNDSTSTWNLKQKNSYFIT